VAANSNIYEQHLAVTNAFHDLLVQHNDGNRHHKIEAQVGDGARMAAKETKRLKSNHDSLKRECEMFVAVKEAN
jgi:hypothetical protein